MQRCAHSSQHVFFWASPHYLHISPSRFSTLLIIPQITSLHLRFEESLPRTTNGKSLGTPCRRERYWASIMNTVSLAHNRLAWGLEGHRVEKERRRAIGDLAHLALEETFFFPTDNYLTGCGNPAHSYQLRISNYRIPSRYILHTTDVTRFSDSPGFRR